MGTYILSPLAAFLLFVMLGIGSTVVAVRVRRLRNAIVSSLLLSALLVMNLVGSGGEGVAQAAAHTPAHATSTGVNGAVGYATSHWQWSIYDNSLPQVYWGDFQPQFQCAEFVARALASSGPIGPLTPTAADSVYSNVTFNASTYNLKLVSSLYHFLLDTGAGTNAGTSLSSATLGSVIIYGNSQDGDFLHTAIVTDTTNASNPLFTEHNAAYLNYPSTTQMSDEYGRPMAITHILQINYGLIAGGALQNSVGSVSGTSLNMNAPAPYHGSIITSGITLSWQAVTGAQTYNVSLYDVNGRLIDGLSTTSTTFSYNLTTASYGVYDYLIQPESSVASFPLYADEFSYEPLACLASGARSTAAHQAPLQVATSLASPATISATNATGSTSCGTGSGTGAASLVPTFSPAEIALTTQPGVKPFAQITLTNSGTTMYNWQLGKEPSWVTMLPDSGSLRPGESENLDVYFWYEGAVPSSSPGTYATTLEIYAADGVYAPVSLPVTVVEANLAQQWYFAEGYTGGSFTEYLTLANPGARGTSAAVTVQYLLRSGSPITKTYYVSGQTRSTINVNNAVGAEQSVSMVVTADQPIIAERPMYFTYTGLLGYSIPGGSDVLGATSLGTQFDFGYLDTSPGHATYLTILNPNSTSMTATVNYYAASGGVPTTITHTFAANSRGTVSVNSEGLAPGSYSALVTLSAPGLVERPMYLVDNITGYTGAADVVGVTQPLTAWYFAEGYTNTNFNERYILSNPNTTTTATATVTFFRADGSTASVTVSVPPGAQHVVNANAILGNAVNNSASVTADQPILAERFMSFRYNGPVGSGSTGQIPGATDVLGAQAPGYVFYFAEGYTGGNFGEYLTLENPNASPAHVTVNYLPQSGAATTTLTYTVNPTSRYTILTNAVMPSQSFSMVVYSDQAIVAERPMYFAYNGTQTNGSDVVGYQPVAPVASLPPSWNIQAGFDCAPNSPYGSWLHGVGGVSSTDVWAVGACAQQGAYWQPLIEHWDGTRWQFSPSPADSTLANLWLNGITAISTDDVWAVGEGGLIEHWDGANWTVAANPAATGWSGSLTAVSAVSASDIWAVGRLYPSTGPVQGFTEHWNGSSWAAVSSPTVGADNVTLTSVSTISSNDVWAVGYVQPTSGPYQPLIEHWDGSSWSIVTCPNPDPANAVILHSVAAAAANDVWAVGEDDGTHVSAAVEHWDGTGWSIVSMPAPPNVTDVSPTAVAVVSSTDVWTVGGAGTGAPLAEHWDGTSWSSVPIPNNQIDQLIGIAVVSASDVWAVGDFVYTGGGGHYPFTEHYGS